MSVFSMTDQKRSALHPVLLQVFDEFIKTTKLDIFVVETFRSATKQKANLASGASTTEHSRHVKANNKSGYACAIDMTPCSADGKTIFWKRLDLFQQINREMMAAAARLKITIEWGGNWKKFKDMDHWQLPWKTYP